MFNCLGEIDQNTGTFHEEGYLLKDDINVINQEYKLPTVSIGNFGYISLFGSEFDKGAVLLKDTTVLFKMARWSIHLAWFYVHLFSGDLIMDC